MNPLTQQELDRVYALPYQRAYHPSYEPLGGVPGIAEVEFFDHAQPRLFWRVQFFAHLRSTKGGM